MQTALWSDCRRGPMSNVCFEVEVHSLLDSKTPKEGTTCKLQVRLKSDDSGDNKAQQLKFTAPFKGSPSTMRVEGDSCGADARLVFSYYRLEQKSADTFLGSFSVPVNRGVHVVKREFPFEKTLDSASISTTVTIRDVTAAQQFMSSLPAAKTSNAQAPGGDKGGGDSTLIPMLSIDDVFESNEAQTDAGDSVKDFAKELAAEFDISGHNVEELAFTALRICDFPVCADAALVPELPMDADIIQIIGVHPTEFKKLRENSNRSADAAGMHAYYDVLKRKNDISNLYNEKDFDWAEEDSDGAMAPGTVSRWNELVEVRCVSSIAARVCMYDVPLPLDAPSASLNALRYSVRKMFSK